MSHPCAQRHRMDDRIGYKDGHCNDQVDFTIVTLTEDPRRDGTQPDSTPCRGLAECGLVCIQDELRANRKSLLTSHSPAIHPPRMRMELDTTSTARRFAAAPMLSPSQ